MIKNKILTIFVLCMMIVTSINQPIYATFETEVPLEISPRFTYISYTTTHLGNISGKASCTATIASKSSTNLKIFLYLQKYVDGTWTHHSSWTESITSTSYTLSKKVSVSSGKYRVKASYYANGENTIQYSTEVNF